METFDITLDTMVVTSSYVTEDKLPILQVSHELDEDGGALWQFHCGNGDYDMKKMQLVRLDTILKIDSSIATLAGLPVGCSANRDSKASPWRITKDQNS